MPNFVRQIIEKMTTRIVLEFQQPLEAKDLALLVALAEKFNASVVEIPDVFTTHPKRAKQQGKNGKSNLSTPRPEPETPNGAKLPSLNIGFEKFPNDLDFFAVKPEQLDALAKIFEDEPPAEVLCEMLTP